eukprot:gnl/TRDRNA2_/TRDRNA2_179834_c0_seq1.p1 gnl/TRDRNA2_/TRDRNA2_179834_c0~~gnl/TRDRNA2_/TRDRNA2_179834_c0_seq1.p1  ORF type:complete len:192 (-),score=29.79 gnl/TRDRNA2_/TRDRNA2_179834_c0_seq1:54-629(-)
MTVGSSFLSCYRTQPASLRLLPRPQRGAMSRLILWLLLVGAPTISVAIMTVNLRAVMGKVALVEGHQTDGGVPWEVDKRDDAPRGHTLRDGADIAAATPPPPPEEHKGKGEVVSVPLASQRNPQLQNVEVLQVGAGASMLQVEPGEPDHGLKTSHREVEPCDEEEPCTPDHRPPDYDPDEADDIPIMGRVR